MWTICYSTPHDVLDLTPSSCANQTYKLSSGAVWIVVISLSLSLPRTRIPFLNPLCWTMLVEWQDPRFERLPCTHAGTYADDCIVNRVSQVSFHPPRWFSMINCSLKLPTWCHDEMRSTQPSRIPLFPPISWMNRSLQNYLSWNKMHVHVQSTVTLYLLVCAMWLCVCSTSVIL